jgi:hypothetical protein
MKGFFFWFDMRLVLLLMAFSLFFSACGETQDNLASKGYQKETKDAIVNRPVTVKINKTPDSICIAAVGDIMLGTSYPDSKTLPPDAGKNSFKNVLSEMRDADVKFGNLEGTLLDTGVPAYFKLHQRSKAWLFRMPVSYGAILKSTGFNLLSLANNHINDFDDKGRISTTKTLDSLGIHYGGLYTNPTSVFKINGVTYGFCAFAPNGETLSIFNLQNARNIIRTLKQQCDIVIVSFHGGGEGAPYEHIPCTYEKYFTENRGDVHAFAHNAIDAGADIILGNGPHVCRAMEVYKNRLIAYSLGNFCTYRSVSIEGICGLAPLVKVYVNKKGEFLSGRIIADKQTRDTGLQPDSMNKAISRIKMLTATDFEQPGLSILDDGRILIVKD